MYGDGRSRRTLSQRFRDGLSLGDRGEITGGHGVAGAGHVLHLADKGRVERYGLRRIESHDLACAAGDDAAGKPGLAQNAGPVANIFRRLSSERACLRLIHEENVDIGNRPLQFHRLGGGNGDGGERLFAGAGDEAERRQRVIRQIGIAEQKVACRDRLAHGTHFQAARGKEPVEVHIGKRDDQIAVTLQNGGVARRAAVKENEGRIFDAGIFCGLRHRFARYVAAAWRDDADGKTEPGKIARRVETTAACLLHPGAGVAGAGRRLSLDHAAPVDMRAAQNEYFLHACVSLFGGWKGRTIRPNLLSVSLLLPVCGDRPEPKNKDRTNHLSLFVFNMLAVPCEMRTNGVHTISILLHCLCGFNNLKVVQMAQNSLRLVEDKSVDKSKALEAALSQIERSFGKGSIMKLGSNENVVEVETVSTGSLSLDIALGIGGLPKGRIVEIYGPESSGKTTLALQTIAEAQKKGGICAFVDAEHALDPVYARKLGVDLQSLLISQPDTGEQALEITDTLVRSGAVDVLVVDSVAALTPRAEIEGEMGDSLPGLQARLMSQALRKLTASISKSKCMVIFINQIRMKIGVMFGSPETTTGGNALKFYASVRLDIRRIGAVKEREEVVGNQTRVKVVKNKMAPPFKQVEFDIMYGEGVSKTGELVDLGVKAGIVEKSGAWFSYNSQRLGQGRENAKTFLRDNPETANEIELALRQNAGLIADRFLQNGGPDAGDSDGDGDEG